MLMCTSFVFLSILEFSMVYLLARDYIKKGPQEQLPNGSTKVCYYSISTGFCVNKIIKTNFMQDSNLKVVRCEATKNMELALKLDKICRYAGPGSFIVLNSIYWIVYVFIV